MINRWYRAPKSVCSYLSLLIFYPVDFRTYLWPSDWTGVIQNEVQPSLRRVASQSLHVIFLSVKLLWLCSLIPLHGPTVSGNGEEGKTWMLTISNWGWQRPRLITNICKPRMPHDQEKNVWFLYEILQISFSLYYDCEERWSAFKLYPSVSIQIKSMAPD